MAIDLSQVKPISDEPFEFGPLQTKWLEALESGEYKQAKSFLYNYEQDSYCCLGVLCKLAGLEFKPNHGENMMQPGYGYVYNGLAVNGYMPDGFANEVGLRGHSGSFRQSMRISDYITAHCLADCNDDYGLSFQDIAAIIRHDPHNIFTKAA